MKNKELKERIKWVYVILCSIGLYFYFLSASYPLLAEYKGVAFIFLFVGILIAVYLDFVWKDE